MASPNELVEGDYVRWRGEVGYEFGTVVELKTSPLGTQEAYIQPDGSAEGTKVSKVVYDVLKIEGGK